MLFHSPCSHIVIVSDFLFLLQLQHIHCGILSFNFLVTCSRFDDFPWVSNSRQTTHKGASTTFNYCISSSSSSQSVTTGSSRCKNQEYTTASSCWVIKLYKLYRGVHHKSHLVCHWIRLRFVLIYSYFCASLHGQLPESFLYYLPTMIEIIHKSYSGGTAALELFLIVSLWEVVGWLASLSRIFWMIRFNKPPIRALPVYQTEWSRKEA